MYVLVSKRAVHFLPRESLFVELLKLHLKQILIVVFVEKFKAYLYKTCMVVSNDLWLYVLNHSKVYLCNNCRDVFVG